ncbi:MAG: hypothetical protein H6937_06800 [Burkholderiales bacterium]|nr:hypothetical protein [Burkholderiales bacterium]
MELARTTNKNNVVSIFVSCIDFTIRSRAFDYRIEQLRRAGINAQVIASRSNEMGLILTELVKEINAMASEVGRILQKVSESGHVLGGLAKDNMRLAGLMKHYFSAMEKTRESKSKDIIHREYSRLHNQIENNFRSIRVQLKSHKITLIDLYATSEFVVPLVSLIKINVAMFAEFSDQFDHVTQELESFHEFIITTVDEMTNEIESALGIINAYLGEQS